ncbi:MAG: exodeoxyribonuclease VII large subunit [Eubacteriales bacterium]|nr:exodeoxyribonuclease VII large subunit [Eubacteriales bacterium]
MAEQLTVTALNRLVANYLANPSLQNLAVAGEISGARLYSSGHFYFTLKDQTAQVFCVMFKSDVQRQGRLPQNGEAVICRGKVNLYERGGSYQLQVRSIDAAGKGTVWQRFEALKQQLEAKGYFDQAHKQTLPFMPRVIGLVTSQDGAVIRDILHVSRRRFPGVSYKLISVHVQGEGAAAEIANAIRLFNVLNNVELIIVARGGGSMEDLWAFNEPSVAEAIYHSQIPLISAVGHETDFTIADFVADKRAPTPSTAAEIAVPVRQELVSRLEYLTQALNRNSLRQVTQKRERLEHCSLRLEQAIKRRLEQEEQRLDLLTAHPVFYRPGLGLEHRRVKLQALLDSMDRQISRRQDVERARLAHLIEKLDLASPNKLLEKGYILALDQQGRPLTEAKQLKLGEYLDLRFQDGLVESKVEAIELHAEDSVD